MEYTDSALRLTPDGAQQVNGVIALFYAPAVKEHLLKLTQKEFDLLAELLRFLSERQDVSLPGRGPPVLPPQPLASGTNPGD